MVCRKAAQNLRALLRVSSNVNIKQKLLLYKGIMKSQFNYYPLVWTFPSGQSNNLINKIDERSLKKNPVIVIC